MCVRKVQGDSGEFDLQAAKEKQSGDCHDKNKTLLAHPEGNQQAIEKCRNIAGDATADKTRILVPKNEQKKEVQEDKMQSFGEWVLERHEDSILQM